MRFKTYREFREGAKRKVKAWLIRENDIEGCEVVFAETRGKAKSIALQTDTFCECDFSCVDECFGEFCEDCLSKEYCGRYDEYIEWCQDYD